MRRALPISVRHLLAVVALIFSTQAASANWVTIKNDTGKPIMVQETIIVNGQVKRGKPIPLLAGETNREFIPGPTVKRIEVFDPQNPNQALWSGNLNCPVENQTFSAALVGGKVTVTQVPLPPQKK